MKTSIEEKVNWEKCRGMLPAIVQEQTGRQVLMLGYMNKEALAKTIATEKVHFYSRTKQRLWKKGESSGHELIVKKISLDCDEDSLLMAATPLGPTCHKGWYSCFAERPIFTLEKLEEIIQERIISESDKSYTKELHKKGTNFIAQKVGEEAIETLIAALTQKENYEAEAADLLYHLLVLCAHTGSSLASIKEVLAARLGKAR